MSAHIPETIIRKYALQNAILFNGHANEKAVLGKVIGHFKKNGISLKELIPLTQKIVTEINTLSQTQQTQELEKLAPELLHKEKKERTFKLPPLFHAIQNQVITRFPPEPNGYLHIGHAKAAIIDYQYAKMYNGKFILRFDDTNPENAQPEFYAAQKEDLQWLGIHWDEEYRTSDHLPQHYRFAEQLITQGDAYVCTCSPDDIKTNRYTKKPCSCRSQRPYDNIQKWHDILLKKQDTGILRLKGDMQSANTAMRDPTLFRIINSSHPIYGTTYHVWPTYDFAGAVEDSISGVTHPFRTKEYELRDECYFYLLDRLHLRKPYLMEFARLSITGMPVSKRKIKPLIDQGIVHGFDDIRLPTLRGLKKRGIHSKAIEQFVLSQGISKVESVVPFGLVEAMNKKLLDPITQRYFFVPNPTKIQVINAPTITKSIPLHPTNKTLGYRKISTSNIFYIPAEDVKDLKVGEIFRLKDLYNIKLVSTTPNVICEFMSYDLISDSRKIQWCTQDHVPLKLFIPHLLFHGEEFNPDSLEEINGFAEEALKQVSLGSVIQFERVGFVRIDKENNNLVGYFTHK
ncbi:MAG: glutamate--tRNA ligase [Candidatus Thermoplasmatota archaeon]|nr:glutamate--tRNA ligase [Candidatus Thermoplasmatota archaeon]MBU1941720.1 glutamate--tRNA ligase [Candidatus Thermoplasmatota archaeon]